MLSTLRLRVPSRENKPSRSPPYNKQPFNFRVQIKSIAKYVEDLDRLPRSVSSHVLSFIGTRRHQSRRYTTVVAFSSEITVPEGDATRTVRFQHHRRTTPPTLNASPEAESHTPAPVEPSNSLDTVDVCAPYVDDSLQSVPSLTTSPAVSPPISESLSAQPPTSSIDTNLTTSTHILATSAATSPDVLALTSSEPHSQVSTVVKASPTIVGSSGSRNVTSYPMLPMPPLPSIPVSPAAPSLPVSPLQSPSCTTEESKFVFGSCGFPMEPKPTAKPIVQILRDPHRAQVKSTQRNSRISVKDQPQRLDDDLEAFSLELTAEMQKIPAKPERVATGTKSIPEVEAFMVEAADAMTHGGSGDAAMDDMSDDSDNDDDIAPDRFAANLHTYQANINQEVASDPTIPQPFIGTFSVCLTQPLLETIQTVAPPQALNAVQREAALILPYQSATPAKQEASWEATATLEAQTSTCDGAVNIDSEAAHISNDDLYGDLPDTPFFDPTLNQQDDNTGNISATTSPDATLTQPASSFQDTDTITTPSSPGNTIVPIEANVPTDSELQQGNLETSKISSEVCEPLIEVALSKFTANTDNQVMPDSSPTERSNDHRARAIRPMPRRLQQRPSTTNTTNTATDSDYTNNHNPPEPEYGQPYYDPSGLAEERPTATGYTGQVMDSGCPTATTQYSSLTGALGGQLPHYPHESAPNVPQTIVREVPTIVANTALMPTASSLPNTGVESGNPSVDSTTLLSNEPQYINTDESQIMLNHPSVTTLTWESSQVEVRVLIPCSWGSDEISSSQLPLSDGNLGAHCVSPGQTNDYNMEPSQQQVSDSMGTVQAADTNMQGILGHPTAGFIPDNYVNCVPPLINSENPTFFSFNTEQDMMDTLPNCQLNSDQVLFPGIVLADQEMEPRLSTPGEPSVRTPFPYTISNDQEFTPVGDYMADEPSLTTHTQAVPNVAITSHPSSQLYTADETGREWLSATMGRSSNLPPRTSTTLALNAESLEECIYTDDDVAAFDRAYATILSESHIEPKDDLLADNLDSLKDKSNDVDEDCTNPNHAEDATGDETPSSPVNRVITTPDPIFIPDFYDDLLSFDGTETPVSVSDQPDVTPLVSLCSSPVQDQTPLPKSLERPSASQEVADIPWFITEDDYFPAKVNIFFTWRPYNLKDRIHPTSREYLRRCSTDADGRSEPRKRRIRRRRPWRQDQCEGRSIESIRKFMGEALVEPSSDSTPRAESPAESSLAVEPSAEPPAEPSAESPVETSLALESSAEPPVEPFQPCPAVDVKEECASSISSIDTSATEDDAIDHDATEHDVPRDVDADTTECNDDSPESVDFPTTPAAHQSHQPTVSSTPRSQPPPLSETERWFARWALRLILLNILYQVFILHFSFLL
ncbi:hypothetical protein QCA50_011278 [Cerrena zonata]|uniref:Uncharacterized protein n=1 Tax=Cerrena zonata TaxID=2478898 RepID=A0AAW0G2R5_9APHY